MKTHYEWLFLVDSKSSSGLGHINRCLNLANELLKGQGRIIFVLNSYIHKTSEFFSRNGFHSVLLDDFTIETYSIDCFICDSYYIDSKVEEIAQNSKFSIQIYDYGECHNFFDVIFAPFHNHQPLKKKNLEFLNGVEYSLVTKYENYRKGITIKPKVQIILLTFGAIDKKENTLYVLKILQSIDYRGIVLIAIPSSSNQIKTIKDALKYFNFTVEFIFDKERVIELFKNTDLIIGSGGLGLLERLCYGIPSISLISSTNQKAQVLGASLAKTTVAINSIGAIDDHHLRKELLHVIKDYAYRKEMSINAMKYIDGRGPARLAKFLRKRLDKCAE